MLLDTACLTESLVSYMILTQDLVRLAEDMPDSAYHTSVSTALQ